MNSRKRRNAVLALSLAGVFVSGVRLHLAGHGFNHALWHDCAVAHVVLSVLFCLLLGKHLAGHWRWYKGIWIGGVRKKTVLTLWLTVLSVWLVVTGCVLLFCIEGSQSVTGHLHGVAGLCMMPFVSFHVCKRVCRRHAEGGR